MNCHSSIIPVGSIDFNAFVYFLFVADTELFSVQLEMNGETEDVGIDSQQENDDTDQFTVTSDHIDRLIEMLASTEAVCLYASDTILELARRKEYLHELAQNGTLFTTNTDSNISNKCLIYSYFPSNPFFFCTLVVQWICSRLWSQHSKSIG